jgi:hypothetical protein
MIIPLIALIPALIAAAATGFYYLDLQRSLPGIFLSAASSVPLLLSLGGEFLETCK